MGADIHMFVAYRNKKRAQELEKTGQDPYWFSFGDRMNPGRNYTLFGVLAGVRGSYPDSFEPKGRLSKKEMSWEGQHEDWLYISEGVEDHVDGCVKPETAERYRSYGCQFIEGPDGKPSWVQHPDHHSHSWMSPDELEEAFNRYQRHASLEWGETVTGAPLEYRALLAAMRTLEEDGENEVRVVFWFDN